MFARLRPVQRFLIAQFICIILTGFLVAIFWGTTGLIAVLIGGGVAMLNAVGTAFAWPRILEKKDIALALIVIVSKFALSIGVFYWLTLPSAVVWFGDQTIALGSTSGTLIAFVLGLTSIVPAALVVAAGDLSGKESVEESITESAEKSVKTETNRNEQT